MNTNIVTRNETLNMGESGKSQVSHAIHTSDLDKLLSLFGKPDTYPYDALLVKLMDESGLSAVAVIREMNLRYETRRLIEAIDRAALFGEPE